MKSLLNLSKAILLLSIFVFCGEEAFGQQKTDPAKILKMRRLGPIVYPNYGMHIEWMPDGEHYIHMEWNCEKDRNNCIPEVVAYSAKDESQTVLIPSEQLLVDKESGTYFYKQKPVDDLIFSENQEKVLLFTDTKKVWRYNTRGAYWVLNRQTGELHQLGKGLPESSLMFAKFSPDASKVAYVSKNNIYVEDLATKTYKAITTDGNDTIVNGTFDWVYEEEFDCRDGFRWSGDGKYIAYWQSNTSGTGWFDIINNVDSIYPTIQHFPYPKAGTTNSAVKIGYVSAEGGETTWLPIPGDERNNYLPRMEFVPGTNRLFIQQMDRPQHTNKVWTATIGQDDLKNIFEDSDVAWVETNNKVQWLKGNKYFTWMSERDGWRHLYRVSADGKQMSLITKGNFDVIRQVGLNEKSGYVYFIASPDNATQRYLYRAKLFGNGQCELVSDINQKGQHSYNMSPTCTWAVHTFSNARTVPQVEMQSFPSGTTVRKMVDNSASQKEFDELGVHPKEFVKVKSGELMLDAWMIKPYNFDASKKYPVIIEVYGEPASSTVQDVWSSSTWYQYMASLGYIIVSIDNRGAAAPRGREWRKCIYGEVGTFASEDQANGILDLARQFPFIDTERIGITGWSGGGSQTLNCMFRYPKIFKTGIAIAFVADQRLYDTIYQERYMNTPQNNPEGYEKGSPISYAENLEGNLLLIHGTGDDNVHYQNCEMLVNKLIEEEKIFYQVSYPMRTHSISEREGTDVHLWKTIENFWLKFLPAGGK